VYTGAVTARSATERALMCNPECARVDRVSTTVIAARCRAGARWCDPDGI